jgi:hypothetical protein
MIALIKQSFSVTRLRTPKGPLTSKVYVRLVRFRCGAQPPALVLYPIGLLVVNPILTYWFSWKSYTILYFCSVGTPFTRYGV